MADFLRQIDSSWTLFLDRDGVINKRPPGDYVKNWHEFEFLQGVTEALKILATKFQRIIIITNQQGIGKNIMTPEDLHLIHSKLKKEVAKKGGRIDAIYFCPDLVTKPNNCRKPSVKMALQAKKDFPEIDFSKSIMAGDTLSDMQFGINAGTKTVYINSNTLEIPESNYNECYKSLIDFAEVLL
ncbi:MAG: HAD family hydrolase [Bacteroidales bacterium]|jgi:histidinol-phosphate phosphatase family protein|nr:HAD family hydrolase [Bacteroidales bacterium]